MSSARTPPAHVPSAHVPSAHVPLSQPEIHKVFYGLMLGGFLSAVNQTIVATALPTIGRELGDFHNLSWVIIAYLLSSTVVAPLYGKLSDIHGRRAMMLAAIGLFIAGSAVSAAAPDMAMLIAGRTLQGIGGGGIVPLTQTTIADMITPRERGRYQAYMGTSWIVAGGSTDLISTRLTRMPHLPVASSSTTRSCWLTLSREVSVSSNVMLPITFRRVVTVSCSIACSGLAIS